MHKIEKKANKHKKNVSNDSKLYHSYRYKKVLKCLHFSQKALNLEIRSLDIRTPSLAISALAFLNTVSHAIDHL